MDRNELLPIKEYLKSIITPHLPKNYNAQLRECLDFCLDVSGKITGDDDRPHKSARPIEITASKEKLEDYAQGPKSSQKSFDERLIKYIKTKTENFNPNHDVPPDRSIPVERWPIPV